MKPTRMLRTLSDLFSPVEKVDTARNLEALSSGERELAEPAPVTPFQVMISDAVRDGLRKAKDPVEILCGETVSFEQLREFLTRKRGSASPVSDAVVRAFIDKHAIPEVATRLYPLGHAVRAAQGK